MKAAIDRVAILASSTIDLSDGGTTGLRDGLPDGPPHSAGPGTPAASTPAGKRAARCGMTGEGGRYAGP